jgi:hypothetical protein
MSCMAIRNRLSRTTSYTERWPNDELEKTDENSKGTITMIVSRKCCYSCTHSAIPDFCQKRPHIQLNIIQGN